MDGNFQAEYMRMKNPENNVSLSDGTGFMVSKKLYKSYLKSWRSGWESAFSISMGTRIPASLGIHPASLKVANK